jgi:hypothetical protein
MGTSPTRRISTMTRPPANTRCSVAESKSSFIGGENSSSFFAALTKWGFEERLHLAPSCNVVARRV